MILRSATLAAIAAALLVAGCGGDDDEIAATDSAVSPPAEQIRTAATSEDSEAQAEPARRRRRGTAIALGDSQFGPVLFGPRRQAIYIFDRERSERPRCYGDCATAWPPVLTRDRPVARSGIRRSLLGTTRRRDGSMQVTYNGHPLYYYQEPPGVVTCHNVREFGGLWLAVRADGNRVP